MAIQYPLPRKGDVVDDFFGTPVADPYRWMEDPAAPEVREFIDAENTITRAYFEGIPARAVIRQQLDALYEKPHLPPYADSAHYGDYYFYSSNMGGDQAVVLRREGVDGEDVVVLDPNTLSADASVILMQTQPSPNGRLLAYSVSHGGSDWQEFRIRDLENGQDFPELVQWCKFTSAAWKQDNSGFYYNRFPAVQPGDVMLVENSNSRIYFHRVGTPQSEDVLIFDDPEHADYLYGAEVSDDGQYLLLSIRSGAVGETGYAYKRIDSDQPFIHLLPDFDAIYNFVGNQGSRFIFLTSLDAPRARLIVIDIDQPDRANWQELIPEATDTLYAARIVGEQLVLFYLHNAHALIKTYALDGTFIRDVALPTMGTVPGYFLHSSADHSDLLFVFTSFLTPVTLFRYDTATNSLSVFASSSTEVDADAYETSQVFYPSTGGVQVSMFISHKRGLVLDGSNPTLIYAYGGFDASVTPEFDAQNYVWMANGGVYAVPNLRGGGEYGEAWHKGGALEHKQNVFDDMIHAAEWLVENGYTSPQKLAIRGASNGGLLVAVCAIQRPDLFGAVLCGVPVTDMLRYQKFTAGRLWVGEYGSAESSREEFSYLYAYSPLHTVREGVAYPPMLIWSSDGDDRVVPMHSLKFTATMQAAHQGENPILLRFGTQVGHGTLTINKVIDEESDFLAFLSDRLGWQP